MRLLICALLLACDKTEKAPPQGEFEASVSLLQSASRESRTDGAVRMMALCCEREDTRACARVDTFLHDEAVTPLHDVFLRSARACYRPLANSIAGACRGRCSAEGKQAIVIALSHVDPTPVVVRAMLRHLEESFDPKQPGAIAETKERARSMQTPQEEVRSTAIFALADLGEDDLEPVLDALANHQDPALRLALVEAVDAALNNAPLHDERVLHILETLSRETSDPLASAAAAVARRFQAQRREAPENVVERLVLGSMNYDVIRMLAVRRFSCLASTAEDALREYARLDPSLSSEVENAVRLRRERCARLR